MPPKMQFGVQVARGASDFSRTSLIIVAPRYVIVNRLGQPVVAREAGGDQMVITNDLNLVHFSQQKLLMLRDLTHEEMKEEGGVQVNNQLQGQIGVWSSPFSVEEVQEF
mmetsp:Transcript_8999/g.8375  ORF Transcript_8999/g.8375 Transcript_8999/m.8375 type:complete len:109 (-) Transcript_8999:1501-1827(-)